MLTSIDERFRIPAPCPAPIGIAYDGQALWVTSYDTKRLYGIDASHGSVFEETPAPGTPFGISITGDELRVICANESDNRRIYRYIVGHGFKNDTVPCPRDTGSHLAYDGHSLFVAQRYDKRILELEAGGAIRRTIPSPREITGITFIDGFFYVVTTESIQVDDYRLLRIDARREPHEVMELATIPFTARGLTYDGTRLWTNARDRNTLVAFALPEG